MSIEVLLRTAEEYLERAIESEQRGLVAKARHLYLQASDCLYRAAAQSRGNLARIRTDNAERLLRHANGIAPKAGGASPEQGSDFGDFVLKERPAVTFDDVAGLDDVKEEIRNKIIYPLAYPEQARRFGIQAGGGVLLYGPPGTGKTYIAKATAHEVDAAFFAIRPSSIMSKWVGESERNIARLFSEARSEPRAIIFVDEVEALIPKRRDSGSTVMQRVVPQILAEMDGIQSKNGSILFMGATNEPWSIDHAALRPGRFDEKIYVPPPDVAARKKLFELNLKGRPVEDGVDLDRLAQITAGYSGADIRQVCLKAALKPFHEAIRGGGQRGISMADIIGALDAVKPSVSQRMVEKYQAFKFG